MRTPSTEQDRLIAAATALGWGNVHFCEFNQRQYKAGKVFGFRPGTPTTMDDWGEEVTWKKIGAVDREAAK